MALTGTLQIALTLTATNTAITDLSQAPTVSAVLSQTQAYSTGQGASQAQQYWADQRTLTATSEDIDVVTPSATDALGVALAFAEIKTIVIRNNSTTDALLVGGKATTAAWNSPFNASDDAKLSVRPGGILILTSPDAAGYACATTTNHLLKIDAAAATIIYDIVIVGNA